MRHTLIAAASVLVLAGQTALAQPATTTGETKAPPRTTSGAATGATTATPTMAPAIARASRLMGRNIENPNGDNIGEIQDMVIDPKTGQIRQVIVGVGGFLGIGQKDVALQWDQLQIEQEVRRVTTPAPGAPGTATGPGTPATAPVPGTPETRADRAPATETSTTAPGTATAPATRAVVATGGPRIVVNMTKEQLEAAPEFRFEDAEVRATTGTTGTRTPATPPAGTPR